MKENKAKKKQSSKVTNTWKVSWEYCIRLTEIYIILHKIKIINIGKYFQFKKLSYLSMSVFYNHLNKINLKKIYSVTSPKRSTSARPGPKTWMELAIVSTVLHKIITWCILFSHRMQGLSMNSHDTCWQPNMPEALTFLTFIQCVLNYVQKYQYLKNIFIK